MARSPSATSRRCFPDTSATRPLLGMRETKAADARNVAAFTAKAGPGPATATSAPATGASAIWEITAADQIAELAATTWSSGTRAGTMLAAAGLKKTLTGQEEGGQVHHGELLVEQDEPDGHPGPGQVGDEHDPPPRVAVDDGTGDEPEEDAGHDLEGNRAPRPSGLTL